MLDPSLKDKEGLPLTCRAVFIVGQPLHPSPPHGCSVGLQPDGTHAAHAGPDKKLKLSLNYPASVGRNMVRSCSIVLMLTVAEGPVQLSVHHQSWCPILGGCHAQPAAWPCIHYGSLGLYLGCCQ